MKKKWSNEETTFLFNNFDSMFIREMAEYLGRTHMSVREKCRRLGLYREHITYIPWSPEEDDLLFNLSDSEVSKKTGRTIQAIKHRKRRIGIQNAKREHETDTNRSVSRMP